MPTHLLGCAFECNRQVLLEAVFQLLRAAVRGDARAVRRGDALLPSKARDLELYQRVLTNSLAMEPS
eukprot:6191570-Pleurochrysis_carterae.AAC.1